jgi:hypothetical protein
MIIKTLAALKADKWLQLDKANRGDASRFD